MAHKKKRAGKPESWHQPVSYEPWLPMPWVHYPGSFGTFFAFQSEPWDDLYLCECARGAILNYVRLRSEVGLSYREYAWDRGNVGAAHLLSSYEFPNRLVRSLVEMEAHTADEVLSALRFAPDPCYECRSTVPSYAFRAEATPGSCSFLVHFGWSIQKQAFAHGLRLDYDGHYLPDVCPPSIQELLRACASPDVELAGGKVKTYLKAWNWAERGARLRLGLPPKGDKGLGEFLLYRIACQLLPRATVVRRHRPSWLDGLEIDVYVEDLRVGLEFQGLQHYQPVRYFGGEEGFRELQARDHKKKRLCAKNGVKLVRVPYWTVLSGERIAHLVGLALPNP